jgi:hypothetical protein
VSSDTEPDAPEREALGAALAEPVPLVLPADEYAVVTRVAAALAGATGERERLGCLVRETWVAWAREQPGPKPSWLTGWDDLDEGQREVDMRIGVAVAVAERERLAGEIEAEAAGHLFTIRRAMRWAVWVVRGRPADDDPGSDYARERSAMAADYSPPCCPVETAAVTRAAAAERERIARHMEALAASYPEDVFHPEGTSRDAIGGNAMRHAYTNAARAIRAGDCES